MFLQYFFIFFTIVISKPVQKLDKGNARVETSVDNNCFAPRYRTNATIILQPADCPDHLCPYSPNQNCTWRIPKTSNFIQITNTPGCINKADIVRLTDCRGNTILTNYDFENPLKLLFGEPEVCIEFVSSTVDDSCNYPTWLLNLTMVESQGIGMEFEVIGNINNQNFGGVDYTHIFSDEKDFEICFTNSYDYVYNNANNSNEFYNPLYTVWKYPNSTGFIGTFRLEDHLKCFESINNTLTVYTNRFFIEKGVVSSIQIWAMLKPELTKNCKDTNDGYFTFLHKIGDIYHFENGATEEGDCESNFAPAIPSYLASVSQTFPTLCVANIHYEGNGALRFVSLPNYTNLINGKLLFECEQDECNSWNNTCVNGNLIKSLIPSGGNATFDVYSIDYPTLQMFEFDEERNGVLMSRNYGFNYTSQNTTQQIVCKTGIAQFNLTFVAVDFSGNHLLEITTDHHIYSYASLNELSNVSLIFNSTKVTINYQNNSLYSIGYLLRYNAVSTNTNPTTYEHSISPIIIRCIILFFVIVAILCVMFVVYLFKCRKPKSDDSNGSRNNIVNIIAEFAQRTIEPIDLSGNFICDINKDKSNLIKEKNKEYYNTLKFPNDKRVYVFNKNDCTNMKALAASNGTVRSCTYKNRYKIAVKCITVQFSLVDSKVKKGRNLDYIDREIENLKLLSECPLIVDFYGFCFSDNNVLIFMELMDFSLHDYYEYMHQIEKCEKIPEEMIGSVAVNIIDALIFCKKSCKIIHRDIKPMNILLKKIGFIKLCDFGESRILNTNSLCTTNTGTLLYIPPERIINPTLKFDDRSDVWGLGITLMEVSMGRIPYTKKDRANLNQYLINNYITHKNFHDLVDKYISSKEYSTNLCKFLKTCVNDLDQRPKYENLVTDRFYIDHQCKTPDDVKKLLENVRL